MDTLSVLIVDDSEINLVVASALLSKKGYKTFTAINGPEALEVLESNSVHLVLLDYDLGIENGNGPEVSRDIREHSKQLKQPIIIGHSSSSDSNHFFLKTEVDGFLSKPFTFSEFQKTIEVFKEYLT